MYKGSDERGRRRDAPSPGSLPPRSLLLGFAARPRIARKLDTKIVKKIIFSFFAAPPRSPRPLLAVLRFTCVSLTIERYRSSKHTPLEIEIRRMVEESSPPKPEALTVFCSRKRLGFKGSGPWVDTKVYTVAPPQVLSTGRVCAELRGAPGPGGGKAYVTSSGNLACPHGEIQASISFWRKRECNGVSMERRDSICRCANTRGLDTAYSGLCRAAPPRAPPENATVFDFLGGLGAKEVTNNGTPQRLVAWSGNENESAWVQPEGTLVCAHGNAKAVLQKMAAERQEIANWKQRGEIGKRPCYVYRSLATIRCECRPWSQRRNGTLLSYLRRSSKNR